MSKAIQTKPLAIRVYIRGGIGSEDMIVVNAATGQPIAGVTGCHSYRDTQDGLIHAEVYIHTTEIVLVEKEVSAQK